MTRKAYLDNGSTTMTAKEVVDEMLPYFSTEYGNPSSIHAMGDTASKAVLTSRRRIASAMGCKPSEIIFTSSGTEADNLALLGVLLASGKKKVVTSAIEHSAVLETCERLREMGYEVVRVPVDREGSVDMGKLDASVDRDTALVSIMAANNVIGTIQPIAEMAEIAHGEGALFHTDAVQAFTKTDIDVKRDRIDLMSISGHKIHGPKGIGALYAANGVKLRAVMLGGGQEHGLRSSTENVPGIVGLGKAAELAMSTMKSDVKRMEKLRDTIIDGVLEIEGSYLNGPREKRICSNAHFGFGGVRGNDLVLALSKAGVYVSAASACSAGSTEPSHVMTAIGKKPEEALSSLRISISRYTTQEETELLLFALPKAVRSARR